MRAMPASQARGIQQRKADCIHGQGEEMRQNKQPSFQFYPADWRKDPALQMCSLEARGCYIDLICVLHEMEFRGVFRVKNEAISLEKISKFSLGAKVRHVQELIRYGVLKVAKRSGCVFSARLVRDEVYRRRLSRKRSKSGIKGMANRWQTDNKRHNKPITKRYQSDNSSSSSSSSTSVITPCSPSLEDKNSKTAVQIFIDLLGEKNLNQVTWSMIETNIPDDPASLDLWQKVVTAWAAVGYSPRNVQGMIDCFGNKEIPGTKKKELSVQEENEAIRESYRRAERNREARLAEDRKHADVFMARLKDQIEKSKSNGLKIDEHKKAVSGQG